MPSELQWVLLCSSHGIENRQGIHRSVLYTLDQEHAIKMELDFNWDSNSNTFKFLGLMLHSSNDAKAKDPHICHWVTSIACGPVHNFTLAWHNLLSWKTWQPRFTGSPIERAGVKLRGNFPSAGWGVASLTCWFRDNLRDEPMVLRLPWWRWYVQPHASKKKNEQRFTAYA